MTLVTFLKRIFSVQRLVLLISAGNIPILAQDFTLAPPPLATATTGMRAVSAGEAVNHVKIVQAQLNTSVSFRDAHYPIDSLLHAVTATGQEWLGRLRPESLTGLQQDLAGTLGVMAGQTADAQDHIAARLAQPGLRLTDRAFTLFTAVRSFADPYYPERLPIAERYLAQLDALGDRAAVWQFAARAALVDVYYLLGQNAEVARHGVRAIRLCKSISYVDQPDLRILYPRTVEALSGQRNSRYQIAALNAIVRAIAVLPPEVATFDSDFVQVEKDRREGAERMIAIAALLGTPGQPLVSNYWVNRPTTDSAVIPVNDGKIRVLEIFSYGCDGCLMALHGLQRIQQQFPGTVEAVATTFTFGYWANRLVSPDEEAERLRDYFVNQLKVTVPIAIWKWPKVPHENGGEAPEGLWETPNGLHYPLIGKPTTYVLDGQGRIRRIFVGGSREIEAQMRKTVEFLQREAKDQAVTKQQATHS